MADERPLTVDIEEAIRRIGDRPRIHTFICGPGLLVGADMDREALIAHMRQRGVENAGPGMCAMHHTLVIRHYKPSPLFIEAAPEEDHAQA